MSTLANVPRINVIFALGTEDTVCDICKIQKMWKKRYCLKFMDEERAEWRICKEHWYECHCMLRRPGFNHFEKWWQETHQGSMPDASYYQGIDDMVWQDGPACSYWFK